MSKQVKIKEVIETLCQMFESHGFPKLSAETMRQAKFDKREAVLPLLDLIFSVLVHVLKEDLKEWSASQKSKLMFAVLKRLAYPRYYGISCSELHSLSSQELLLAFGFLLVKLDIIGHLRDNAQNLVIDEILESCKKSQKSVILLPLKGRLDFDQIVRTSKRTEFVTRDLISGSSFLDKLLRKFDTLDKSEIVKGIHEGERPSASKRSHQVTPLDMIFFENFRLQKDCIPLLRKQIELLQLHVKWSQNETLFWKWLASIQPKQIIGVPKLPPPSSQKKGCGSRQRYSPDYIKTLIKRILQTPEFRFGDEREKLVSSQSDNDVDDSGMEHSKQLLKEIEERIEGLRAVNKDWLTSFLCQHFPSVIQLPELDGIPHK